MLPLRSVDRLRDWHRNLGLQARLTLQIVLLSTAVFALLLPIVLLILDRALQNTTQEKGFSLVRVFAVSSVQGVATDDFSALEGLVRSLARQPEVRYAMILDLKGRVLVHSTAAQAGTLLGDPVSLRAMEATAPLAQEARTDAGEPIHDFAAPILLLNERRAVARVGVSFESEERVLRQTRNAILGLGFLTLIGGLLWVRFHVGGLARPIQALMHGAEAVAQGDLERRIPVERRDEVGRLGEAFNRMAESLKAYREIDHEITSTLELDAVLQTIAQYARTILKVDIAHVAACDPRTGIANVVAGYGAQGGYLVAGYGDQEGFPRGLEIVPGRGIGGYVLATGRPLVINDYEHDPRITQKHHESLRREGIVALMVVPIPLKEKTIGLLYAANRRPTAFTSGDQETLSRLAAQAAIAIENATLYAQVRQYAEELEAKVADRTRDLAAANEKLKELDSLKSEFVSNVSHELRTPLTTIRMSVENLLDGVAGEMSPVLQRSLTRVKENTDRLVRLIADLLDLSRIEAGRVEIRLDRVPVLPLVQDVLEGFRAMAAQKGLVVAPATDSEPAEAMADRDRLHQVLTNLVGNAVKFTPHGGSVTVLTRVVPKDASVQGTQETREYVEVSVIDTGEGIPPEELTAIFDKFYQVRREGRRKTPGTGLGLAIAKSLVELQGGRIWAEGEPGRGSRFVFTLPLAETPGSAGVASDLGG